MECPRGTETTLSTHEIKTIKKAREWIRGSFSPEWLPITVEQNKTGNGRLLVRVFSKWGTLIERRG